MLSERSNSAICRSPLLHLAVWTLTAVAAAQAAEPTVDGRAADKYRLKRFATEPPFPAPSRMNDRGTMVGWFLELNMPLRATADGRVTALPLTSADYGAGAAIGVNEADEAVGYQAALMTEEVRAVKWPPEGGVVDLSAKLSPHPGHRGYAMDINDHGQVVGYYSEKPREFHTVVWEADGTPHVLPNPDWAPIMWGQRINNQGHVAGSVLTHKTGYGLGFFWSAATGVLGMGPVTAVHGMNDRDEVVGKGNHETYGHAFYWNPGMGSRVQNLPLVKGFRRCSATAISPDSLIVGYCDAAAVPGPRGRVVSVAWERQADGAWLPLELESRFRRHAYNATSSVLDIDSRGRMLFEFDDGSLPPVFGIAVPVAVRRLQH
ncbi:hypothetical protein [Ideonella sp.]|uniref:hypothetical protein n=1 Tax=Ideonella sp. TaxID=1929293 RepID=UPI0035B1C29D